MKLLLILYAVQAKALQFSMVSMISVTIGVLEKYHTTCLYLLDSTTNPDYALKKPTNMEYIKTLTKWENIQITVISMNMLVTTSDYYKCQENLPLYLILASDESVQTYLSKLSKKLALSRGRWLMFLSNDVNIESYFVGIHVPYNCEFLVVQNTSQKALSLTEIYREQPNQRLQTNVLANWLDNSLQWIQISLLERRGNLQRAPIRVSIEPKHEEYTKINCKVNDGGDFCTIYYPIWNIIQTKINAISKYKVHPEKEYTVGNLTFSGVVGHLISNEADVAVELYGMSAERIRVVNYISNAFPKKVTTVIRREKVEVSKWDKFLGPFSTGLWWSVFISFVILTTILSTTWRITVRMNISPSGENYSFNNTWIIVIGCLCQQGQETTPQAWSCRFIFLTIYLTYLVLIAAYSAIFISFLAVHRDYLPFSDFQSLLDTGTYRFGTYKSKLYVGMFKSATNPTMRKVYEKLLAPQWDSLPEDSTAGLSRVCEERNYAFLMNADLVQLSKPRKCDVMEIPGASISMPASFLISKSCPYYRLLTHQMENLRRFGILQKIVGVIAELEEPAREHTEASMEDVLAIFIILFAGIFISLCCLTAELLISKYG